MKMGYILTPTERMGKSKLFRIFLLLGSFFMILLIIIYWDDVASNHFYLHNVISGSQSSHLPSNVRSFQNQNEEPVYSEKLPFTSDVEDILHQILEFTTKGNTVLNEHKDQRITNKKSVTERLEENFRGYDWKSRHSTNSNRTHSQIERKQLVSYTCTSSSLDFPGKNRTFDDIPNKELDHLIVDDRHGIIYCYVPKVACTNWKRVMIVLAESLEHQGMPYLNPLEIPREHVHDVNAHLTFSKFWRRYGKFSKHLMNIKLKKYTKFLFVRDPFLRLISAYRSKFAIENEEFYKSFAVTMLKRFTNHTDPPKSVVDAFVAGIKPSFSNFIQYLLDPQTEKHAPFNEHWRQMYRLCHPCQINYDFVGKLETLDEDAEFLLKLLKVDDLVQLPPSFHNKTVSSWEEEWFASIPVEWRQQLYELYEADFKLFGYPKPEKLLQD
ncbi:carbohydrate sulfotransferase 12 [Erpetoichthys calabaricus]|uniref:Carbohydrate sulfotransferase n=1 Tax=Erpetoichthys calabaricus TaxID=27687 RepID=A0A8C4SI22_ERPCA|nr:carbohydrate sulfotransferase 12 [Erpetoichthys calabaricus]XP_028669767.1 carbohydrate sulfotransferase 12 [Erpetoichthys calabaricus]